MASRVSDLLITEANSLAICRPIHWPMTNLSIYKVYPSIPASGSHYECRIRVLCSRTVCPSLSLSLSLSRTPLWSVLFCFVWFSVCPMTQSHTHTHTHVANTLRKHCANNKLTNKYEKLPGKTFSVFVFRCQVAHGKGQSFYYEPLGTLAKLGREYKII